VLIPVGILVAVFVLLSLLRIPKVVLPEISIPAEPVLTLFGFKITNTLLATWLTMLLLIVGSWAATRKMRMVPRRWQSALETVVESLLGLVEGAAGRKAARRYLPIVATLFLFLLVSNWLGLTPLFGSWGILEEAHEAGKGHPVQWNASHTAGLLVREGTGAEEEKMYVLAPMFRSAATDMNTTIALALISVALTQYFGFRAMGFSYFGKFVAVKKVASAFTKKGVGCMGRVFSFFLGLIDIFVGFVETISEIAKVISFSFRLFGNISAGEVLLGVLAFLIPYLVSLPFFGLELLVGFVQGLVFMMLTVAFFVTATSGHGGEEH
jgi:F-type H+-transporting ATPase subunit a